MKSVKNNWIYSLIVALMMFSQLNCTAQGNNAFSWNDKSKSDNIVMTWNKNTPESEMKDDIKALANKGVTIKYSNVKRNSNNEITAIKVEYTDRNGSKGKLELENKNPINTIKFFKIEDEVGFGEPSNSNDMFGGNPFFQGFSSPNDMMKQFKFNDGDSNSQSFSFSFPNEGEGFKSKSQIKIQKEGKKPLVIENGEVIEGGDDYTPEEIEEIKKNNKLEFSDDFNKGFEKEFDGKEFDFRNNEGLENFKKQMEKIKSEVRIDNNDNEDLEKAKQEMLKAKDEMNKAKEELEKARKEIEKSKPSVKTSKA